MIRIFEGSILIRLISEPTPYVILDYLFTRLSKFMLRNIDQYFFKHYLCISNKTALFITFKICRDPCLRENTNNFFVLGKNIRFRNPRIIGSLIPCSIK